MSVKTRGIILQATNYSETSLVVKIYTEQAGLGPFIVSGVRTKKSRFNSNIFQPLTLVELVATGRAGQMQRINDIHLSPPLAGMSGDIIKSSIAIFLAEVVVRSIREEEPNQNLFGFLHNSIQILDLCHDNCSKFHIYFMVRFSRHLGFFPHGECTEGVSVFDLKEGCFTDSIPSHPHFIDHNLSWSLHQLMYSDFENYKDIPITGTAAKVLLKALILYFEIHHTHGNAIKSHTILEEVLG